jgi:SET domain-containing protein
MMDVIVGSSNIQGKGVFAARDYQAGEVMLLIDDTRVVDAEHPLRPDCEEFEYHCDYLAEGKIVLMQSPERYINSSCDPNTYVKYDQGKRLVISRRGIKAGEEISYDYIIDCHGGKEWRCNCGAARCRGKIVSSFFELPLWLQEEYLPLLSDWFVEEHRGMMEWLHITHSYPPTDTQ